MRKSTGPTRNSQPARAGQSQRRQSNRRDPLATRRDPPSNKQGTATSTLVKVSGWKNSNASTNSDGGVEALTKFIERRGAMHKGSPVRIRKSRVDGENFIITISQEDLKPILGIKGLQFAGSKLMVIPAHASSTRSGPATSTFSFSQNDATSSLSPTEITAKFKAILASRYNVDAKLLDLSSLGTDPELNAMGIKDVVSRQSFFPALMKVCDQTFPTPDMKREAVVSISLARNNLLKVTPIRLLADTFPDLKNLDLSGNKFNNMGSLLQWQKSFPTLENIVLQDMPLSMDEASNRFQVLRLFPNLRQINSIQILESELQSARSDKPLPITKSPVFEDAGGIAQSFIRAYFTYFDSDRAILTTQAYDDDSTFSIAVSTRGKKNRTSNQPNSGWGAWIPKSRNLVRITNPVARHKRLHTGREDIAKVLNELPTTRHPSFDAEAEKWLIECRSQSGCPDPTGQAPAGVNGFLITIHGEFDEVDTAGNSKSKRSFDRTFVIGPGGATGVRIINDQLTVREYSGYEAFKPKEEATQDPDVEKASAITAVQGLTGMNAQYAQMCLEQSGYNVQEAVANFERVRATIPPEAYVQ